MSIYHWDSLNTILRKQTIVVVLTNGTVSKQIDFMKCECKCCRHQLNRQCILLLNMYCVAMFPEGVYRRWDDFIVYSQLPIVQLLNVLNMSLWSFKCYLMNIFLVKPLISSAYFTTKWILFCYWVSIKLLFITINHEVNIVEWIKNNKAIYIHASINSNDTTRFPTNSRDDVFIVSSIL